MDVSESLPKYVLVKPYDEILYISIFILQVECTCFERDFNFSALWCLFKIFIFN